MAPIVTQVVPAGVFYPAQAYHQNYHQKNPVRYKYYRLSCGRDAGLQQLWGKQPSCAVGGSVGAPWMPNGSPCYRSYAPWRGLAAQRDENLALAGTHGMPRPVTQR